MCYLIQQKNVRVDATSIWSEHNRWSSHYSLTRNYWVGTGSEFRTRTYVRKLWYVLGKQQNVSGSNGYCKRSLKRWRSCRLIDESGHGRRGGRNDEDAGDAIPASRADHIGDPPLIARQIAVAVQVRVQGLAGHRLRRRLLLRGAHPPTSPAEQEALHPAHRTILLGKICYCTHHTFLLGFPTGWLSARIKLIFWHRCRGLKKKKLPRQIHFPTSTTCQQ
jgi:hypothetical protein